MELEFQEIEFNAKIPIFREPYSGVFKFYSDVLKPYSGVFLQKFFYKCDHIPSSRSLIVAFLSPIVAFFCNLWNSSL